MTITKEEMLKHMRLSKVSGMTQARLDLAKKTSWKSLGCAPSMREVAAKGVKNLAHRSQNLR